MFPSTAINFNSFKYWRDSDQEVILGYLAPLATDIKFYLLFNLLCSLFNGFLGNIDCLVTYWLELSLNHHYS